MTDLVVVERGASIGHRTAIFINYDVVELTLVFGYVDEAKVRAQVGPSVVNVSVVEWSCVHIWRTGRGMFRKGCFWNCRRDDGIFRGVLV
jgi:hypothetical protein